MCSFGDAATTSFFPAKPLGCYGDGGAIFTNNDELANTLRSIRAQGRSLEDKYDNRAVGVNSRLDTLQAAILLPKLEAFIEYELGAVNRVAELYTEQLSGVVQTPFIPDGYYSSWAQYTITLENKEQRDSLRRHLKEQTVFANLGQDPSLFPNSGKVAETVLSLPMHPYLEQNKVENVCEITKSGL